MSDNVQENKIRKALYKLGFKHKEILVYLAVLSNNESSILSITQETKISRGTVYDIVEKLKIKGFLIETKCGKKRKIIAENPTSKFYSVLDEKFKELNAKKRVTDELLENIKTLGVLKSYKPELKIYKGEKGFRQIWDDIFLSKKKQWLGIARIETFVEFGGEEYLNELQQRKKKLGFSSRAINENSALARKLQSEDDAYNRHTKIAPSEFKFDTTEIIYGNKIAMFSTKIENIVIVIESKDFSKAHRVYFEMMWKLLE